MIEPATLEDVPHLVALRAAVAEKLTANFGEGPWSRKSGEKGVLLDLRTSKVLVARRKNRLIASLRLTTKKPWAIDRSYFSPADRPIYLLSMAVAPDLQRQGIGRRCLKDALEICRR